MVDRFTPKQCNGCRVCADICPKAAISFHADPLTGFEYPSVDRGVCVECGKCVKECPQNEPVRRDNAQVPEVWAAWSQDDDVRMLCTSGGLFYEFARRVIEEQGAVVACSYTDDYRGAYHCVATTMEELIPLCGSKHVQSQTLHIYRRVKELLRTRPSVLFVGTPCQVAALYRYLGNDDPKLLTIDFICNSINSPKAQGKYIDYLEQRFGAKVTTARSKDKRYGWNHFGSSARFANGKEYYASRDRDARVVGYHRGHLFIRESCTACQYKVWPRNADITLGDFWGIEPDARNPKLEKGTSVAILNSEKGKEAMGRLEGRIGCYQKTVEDVLRGNRALVESAKTNGNSAKAFAALENKRFDRVVNAYRDRTSPRAILGKVRGKFLQIRRP